MDPETFQTWADRINDPPTVARDQDAMARAEREALARYLAAQS